MPIVKDNISSKYNYCGETKYNQDGSAYSDDQYKFDMAEYTQLLNSKRYTDAANYMAQYKFKDKEQNDIWRGKIMTLRTEGEKLEYLYGVKETEPGGKDKVDACMFSDAVFRDGGLEGLDVDNKWKNAYIKAKQAIGSSGIPGTKDYKEATKLSITFKPQSRSYFGIDRLAVDNDFNIDNFCNTDLFDSKKLNIKRNKDGSAVLTFNKSDANANAILYRLGQMSNDVHLPNLNGTNNYPLVKGYDLNNKEITQVRDYPNSAFDMPRLTKIKFKNVDDTTYLTDIRNLYAGVEEAKGQQREVEEPINDETYNFESYTFGTFGDSDGELEEQRRQNLISQSDYEQALKQNAKDVYDDLTHLDLAAYSGGKIYSTLGYDDGVAHEMNINELNALSANFNFAKSDGSHFKVSYGMSGNKSGIFIEITHDPMSETQSKYDYQYKPCTIFVENLWSDKTNAALATNADAQAAYTINNMRHYGYEHHLTNGNKISIVDAQGNGYYTIKENGKYITEYRSADDLRKLIKFDILKDQASNELVYQYTNDKGELNREDYLAQAKLVSTAIANNMNKGKTPLTSLDYFGPQSFDLDNYEQSLDSIYENRYNNPDYQYSLNQFGDAYNVFSYLCNYIKGYPYAPTSTKKQNK